mgnify:CR=1 FL=1
MTAYIVGLIVGALVTVFPVIYMMHFDRCVAAVLEAQPEFSPDRFDPSYSATLLASVTTVGAVVLLLSIAMIAITGLHGLRGEPGSPQEPVTPDEAAADQDQAQTPSV